ncbi:MAG: pseudaminic acid biosynthesis-associated methylase [Desulfomonilaceae bacterium]
MAETVQLKAWAGEFGDAYTDRNVVDWRTRLSAFRTMLEGTEPGSILELGSNRGHNLILLSELFAGAQVVGLEPNMKALRIAQQTCGAMRIIRGNALEIPFGNSRFDLVITANMLIHIAIEDLAAVLKEIYRVSRKYILSIEYFAEEETVIHYRGHDDLLWKRNFPEHYRSQFPALRLLKSGYWDSDNGFDRSHWWLWEKDPA